MNGQRKDGPAKFGRWYQDRNEPGRKCTGGPPNRCFLGERSCRRGLNAESHEVIV